MTDATDDAMREFAERVASDPEITRVAEVLQRKLERLNGEGFAVCPPDEVESTAWLLAEEVVYYFQLKWRRDDD